MTTLIESADIYFSSINPVASKIAQDIEQIKESIGYNNWDDINENEREEIINYHLIGSEISEKYSEYSQPEDLVECFPRLMITPGEKIVVDFENSDGWTWRDEHSAPFSWETRSQLEMPFEDDSERLQDESTNKSSTATFKPKRPKTPDRDTSLAFKPEKSIWESPFLKADHGLESGYTSSQSSDYSKVTDDSGASFTCKSTGDPNSSAYNNSASLAEPPKIVEKIKLSVTSRPKVPPPPPPVKVAPPPPPVQTIDRCDAPASPDHIQHEVKDKRWNPDRDACTERGDVLTTKLTGDNRSLYTYNDDGDDDTVMIRHTGIDDMNTNTTASDRRSILDDQNDDLLDLGRSVLMDSSEGTQPENPSDLAKTGFDFLDNW